MENWQDTIINVVIILLLLVVIYKLVIKKILAKKESRKKATKITRKEVTVEEEPVSLFGGSSRPSIEPETLAKEKIKHGVKTRFLRIKDIFNLFPGLYTIPIVWGFTLLVLFGLQLYFGPQLHTIGPEYIEIGFLGFALGVLALELVFILTLLEFPGLWGHMKNKGFIKDFTEMQPQHRWFVLLASLFLVSYVVVNSMQLI